MTNLTILTLLDAHEAHPVGAIGLNGERSFSTDPLSGGANRRLLWSFKLLDIDNHALYKAWSTQQQLQIITPKGQQLTATVVALPRRAGESGWIGIEPNA